MSTLDSDNESSVSKIKNNISREVMAHKLKKSCRLCLNERRSQVSLFEKTSSSSLTNAEIVQLFFDIPTDPNDGLPGMICTKCENMLHLILDFKFECQDSNETLLAIFEALNPKLELKENPRENFEDECEEEEFLEENMYIEALESKDDDESKIMCKMESVVEELEEIGTTSEEFNSEKQNENLVFDTEEKQDIILLTIMDQESPNAQIESEETWQQPKKPLRNKNSKCPECGKMVEGPAKLTRHMRVHERERKKADLPPKQPKSYPPPTVNVFKCTVCMKEFNLGSRLKKHLETHLPMSMREKTYVCHCGKQYLDSAALRTHQTITHSENVPIYACEICSKEFTRKNYRDYHQRLHTSDKPHACEICDFRSAKKHNLKRHMLVHSDEFNYQCDTCGRKFKRITGLQSHQKTHEYTQSYMCPKCSRAYPSKNHLLGHLQNVHQIEITSDEFDQILQDSKKEIYLRETTENKSLIFAMEEMTND